MTLTRAPFGTWRSPITAAAIVSGAVTISEVVVDRDDIWWAEMRPEENGRVAIMRRSAEGTTGEITPPLANVRTRVHEYGGGAWWVDQRVLVYAEHADQQLRKLVDGTVTFLTDDPRDRFADGRLTRDARWYVCVRERHLGGNREPHNELVAVATDGSQRVEVLASGSDFVASPRPSPDGSRLAWLQWNHPDMPWDGTELWVAELGDGTVRGAHRVAGGRNEALMQPEWSPQGVLHVLSDRSDWWNVYEVRDDGALLDVVTGPFEIGLPAWVFGQSAYAFRADGRVVTDADVRHVLSEPTCVRTRGERVVVAGASWAAETQVVEIGPDGAIDYVRAARSLPYDPHFFPEPEAISFSTCDGGEVTAHALFYAPANPGWAGARGERPPVIVFAHSGPTSAARRALHLLLRYWTSRGFAVVDVDYRGSTGYGRTYRHALDGQWGVVDVDDCVAAARYLVARGDVDGDRLLIRGGSAGGFTALCALAFRDCFAAGASNYGIADLEALALDTHKFESRYLDRLVGPYPERRDLYVERSPVRHPDRFHAPMIILQGLLDRVVPPNQANMMVTALRAKGVPSAYVLFPDEGHGFRKADNIVRALESELSFYAQLFGFTPADPIEPVAIEPVAYPPGSPGRESLRPQ